MDKLTPEQNEKITEEIKCATRLRFEKAGFTVDKIARELAIVAYSDPAHFVDVAEGGELSFKTFKQMGMKRRAIKKIREKTVITESKDGEKLYKTSTVEYETHDKMDALGKAIAVIGIQKPLRMEHDVAGNLADLMRKHLAEKLNAGNPEK
jgi:hypothetical protein